MTGKFIKGGGWREKGKEKQNERKGRDGEKGRTVSSQQEGEKREEARRANMGEKGREEEGREWRAGK